ncbi:MAG: galactoside O-acetyltransferase [Zetaproteobacteria bacterium CG23_combo_of_CG06-09_8_20_14_all_54_7]|nr:MAG: galactoside O-acetyltransferase [Zetaproteobacteria bacterium CG23_combo_of_CG06-09_8_20_14_all_54_7]
MKAVATWHLVFNRMRTWRYLLLGCKGLQKCLIGPRVRIDVAMQVSIGSRTQLESDVWLKLVDSKARLEIGRYGFIGRGVEIDVSEQVTIGDHVLIAPGVFITDHSHNIKAGLLIDAQGCSSAPVCIGDDVWIGARAVILPGVNIGRGAVIGAGAVVTRNVAANSVVAGVPARLLRDRTGMAMGNAAND